MARWRQTTLQQALLRQNDEAYLETKTCNCPGDTGHREVAVPASIASASREVFEDNAYYCIRLHAFWRTSMVILEEGWVRGESPQAFKSLSRLPPVRQRGFVTS
jgi:hypothetical protein